MGAWGTGIFANDTAADVRAAFRRSIDDGKTPTAARQLLLKRLTPALKDSDDRPIIWMSLAATQLECHCLEELVRKKALAIIGAGGDIDRWQETGDAKLVSARRAVLERLRAKLASPQPKSKSRSKPKPKAKSKRFVESKKNFPLGEVFAYRLASGDHVLLHVVDYSGNRELGFMPVCALLDWRGHQLPSADEIRAIPLLIVNTDYRGPMPFMIQVYRKKEKELPTDRVVRLGVLRERHCDKVRGGYSFVTWGSMDRSFESWLGWE